MSEPGGEAQQGWTEGGPERLYVVTAGRGRPTDRVPFDLVTLIVAHILPPPGMHPEQSAILRMCANPLSIAEISAYLALPASTVMVLVADLVDGGQAEARAPAAMQARPRIELLEAVMDGLSKI